MQAWHIFVLSAAFGLAATLQILACALPVFDGNCWPLLASAIYVLLPMPILFLGSGGADSYTNLGEPDTWLDVAKFLTGMSAVGTIGIPVVLVHAGLMVPLQLAYCIPSALLLAGTGCGYVVLSRQADGGYGYDGL